MTVLLVLTIGLNLFLIWAGFQLLDDCITYKKELEDARNALKTMQKVERVRANLDSAEPAVIDELYSKFDRNP